MRQWRIRQVDRAIRIVAINTEPLLDDWHNDVEDGTGMVLGNSAAWDPDATAPNSATAMSNAVQGFMIPSDMSDYVSHES